MPSTGETLRVAASRISTRPRRTRGSASATPRPRPPRGLATCTNRPERGDEVFSGEEASGDGEGHDDDVDDAEWVEYRCEACDRTLRGRRNVARTSREETSEARGGDDGRARPGAEALAGRASDAFVLRRWQRRRGCGRRLGAAVAARRRVRGRTVCVVCRVRLRERAPLWMRDVSVDGAEAETRPRARMRSSLRA